MESKAFLDLLNKALQRKNQRILTYKKFKQGPMQREVQQLLEGILDKEQKHLELLELIQQSVRNGSEAPVQAFANANLSQKDAAAFQRNIEYPLQTETAGQPESQFQSGTGQMIDRPHRRAVFSSKFNIY